MKILQLELTAFGFFTDKTLDFSKGHFHLLYGANEAGKSTMRRALTSMFFGVPERTADAYLHPNDQLRIGVRLQRENGEELICYRRKGRKNTLLDTNNKPLDEAVLQAFFGGMNETQFTAQCCFDHERLRQGGEDLLSGGGNVGESLFEAGTGSLKVHDVLVELTKEKEELFKARGTKPLLNKTIRLYKDACQRIKECSLSANKWSEHAKKLDEVRQQHTLLTQKLQSLRAEQYRIARIQRTRPLLLRNQELKAEWINLNSVVILPDDAASKHFQAKLALRTAKNQEEQALRDINHLQHQIEAIKIPETLLAHKETLDDLRGRLGSHQKAARDLPGVRTEMRTVESEARALLRRIYPQLDLQEVSTKIIVTNPQREHLKRLASNAPALHEKQYSIIKRLEEMREQLAQQHNALEVLKLPPDLTMLQTALGQACKYGNLEEIHAKNEQEIRLLTDKINIGLKQIGWSGNLETLEQTALPRAERIESFDRRFKEVENDRQRIKERVLETRQKNERSTQKINALCWAGEIPTEEALTKARKQRQQHWLKIKQLKSPQLPLDKGEIDDIYKTFEKVLLHVDELADRLRREASRVAEYTMLLAEQQSAQREQEQQTKKWHTCESLLTNLQHEWEESWKPVGIKPWSPAEMRGWLNECLNLRQQANILREKRQLLEEKQQLIVNLCRELTEALTPFKSLFIKGDILTRLLDIIKQGETCVTTITKLQRQRENLQLEINNLIKEQQRTETAQQQAFDALKRWQTEWTSALSPLQMSPDTPPETARNVLNDLDQVLNKIDKVNGLRRRVDLMERDAEIFRRDVATVVQAIAPELINEAVEHVIPTLSNRLSQAEQDLTRAEQLQQRLQVEQQRKANAYQQVQSSQTHLSALLEQAHCSDLVALEEAEQASLHKKDVQREIVEVEQQLLEQGEGLSLTELANAVATVDIDQLPSQLQQCKEQIQNLEQERSSIDQSIGELRTLLKQMDGNAQAAQAADEAQLALAEIQNLSERYMQIHLAASVLRKSIERFREQNQGPLVKRASELFQHLTLNSFCGLKTDYQNDQPVLVGLRTKNSVGIPITGMSEGTRDQMYLALRLASIERYIKKNSPIPLILDDILINFDDERSRATLSVLGELAQQTQILFLTHHPRLVELAQKEVAPESLVMHQL
ncbi:AAA family ATPase [Candidatus Parabeggiatoa sp. HSG14]|uniref:AAA family ATPase n=1 Tax=Candidatus Parabeggiatoa sp. HSG14 TaxID=3055593 RepID=UPI0025A8CACA|nr:AAA family ATPase [Thiotrichales bacterium HSG14]